MAFIIAIIGYAETGKTTLIEKLVPELKSRGYRVGTIKHAMHEAVFDTKGKDSWRHFMAGADSAMVASDGAVAMIKKRRGPASDPTTELMALARYFADVDIVIAEGYKTADCPKIEVYRASADAPPLSLSIDAVLAVVSDVPIESPNVAFKPGEIGRIADFIEAKGLEK